MAEETFETLEALVRSIQAKQCEGQTVEVKAALDGTPKVYETLSSFSNQNNGGVIVFGLDEPHGFKVVGVHDAQVLQKNICEQCAEMAPPVRPVFTDGVIDGKVVVAAYIEGRPMSERPIYRSQSGITKGSYIRAGDADLRMSPAELYEIDVFKNGKRDDISVCPDAEMTMLDDDAVLAFIQKAKEDRPHMMRRSREEILGLVGAEKGGRPTLSGMFTLSDYPQQAYPNLCVTAVSVAGTHLDSGEGGSRFLDNKRFEGPIDQMIDDTMAFVRRNTKTRVVIRNGERVDVPEYPENAVREVLANALMHRDYGPYCNGTPVRLALYSNRLECWNPGGIYGGQDVEDLGHTNIQTRNPTLVSMLEIQGVAENRHSGIPVIRDEMGAAGLRPPVFTDSRNSFKVELFNAPECEASDGIGRMDREKMVAESILEFCETPRSKQEIADHVGLSSAYAQRKYIKPLLDKGRLQLTLPEKPQSKFQRYRRR